MIIEIKGLPNGKSIKHINIDVTFDEGGNAKVEQTVDQDEPVILSGNPISPSPQSNADSPAVPNIPEPEAKEIPKEMTDMEF